MGMTSSVQKYIFDQPVDKHIPNPPQIPEKICYYCIYCKYDEWEGPLCLKDKEHPQRHPRVCEDYDEKV